MKYIIGCDPDSNKSGIALYENGKLVDLECLPLVKIYQSFEKLKGIDAELHIENIHGQKGVWHKGGNGAARKVGRCEQVQIEIERIAEHFGIKVIRHKVSSAWKSQEGKAQFENITGWTASSNEDSRSACWFGHQGVLSSKRL